MPNTESPTPTIERTAVEIRRRVGMWKRAGERTALVPTMGALHEGHLALIRAAQARCQRAIVSIFVNPTQFAPNEDLDTYPRTEEADLAALATLGVDAIFAPSVEEMYPSGFATAITISGPADGLESDTRPHFFGGVATVVAKLLLACGPDCAIFGEKDYQQLLVIRRMVADLGIPVAIIGHETIREADGLALSSRNAYLSSSGRQAAPRLFQSLQSAAAAIKAGALVENALSAARDNLKNAGFQIDYFELRNADTLAPVVDPKHEPLRLLAAAKLGTTRLIDNIPA